MFYKAGFKKVDLEDIPIYEAYYQKMEGPWASSICIDSILAWNDSIFTYYKIINEYICSVAYDAVNRRFVCLPLIGSYENGQLKETFQIMMGIFEELQLPFIMTDIYQWMLDKYLQLDIADFGYDNDEGLSDYIYTMEDFKAALNEQDIRYNIRYFMRKYDTVITELEDGDASDCIRFISDTWCADNDCSDCEYGCMKIVADSIISNISRYNAQGVIIRSQGEVIAYCIVSVRQGVAMFHFKKTARHYRGINEVLHKECVERFCDGVKFINYTEDMNHEGLRKYKRRLAKYTLEPKYELYLKRERAHHSRGMKA